MNTQDRDDRQKQHSSKPTDRKPFDYTARAQKAEEDPAPEVKQQTKVEKPKDLVRVTTKAVYVRSFKSTGSEAMFIARINETFEVISDDDQWVEVVIPDSKDEVGYILKIYTESV